MGTDGEHGLLEAYLELSVIVAALATVPLTVFQERGATGPEILAADWTIWAVFAVEYAYGVSRAESWWRYSRRNWLDVAVVVLSFPALPAVLAFTRLARLTRLTRLARLIRLVSVGARGLRALRSAIGKPGLLYVASVSFVLVFLGGGLLAILEPETAGGFWSGVWWAVVTATTVGYGDISPATLPGRLIAIVLMVIGIGLLATLAASVAAHFVGDEEEPKLEEINDRLSRIEALLEEMRMNRGGQL